MRDFGCFYPDKEKDIVVALREEGGRLYFTLRTPNHSTGNLITNLAALCHLPLSFDENGLKIIEGTVPSYYNADGEKVFIFRLGDTKVATIHEDGRIELKASIPAIAKTLMSQTKDYRLSIRETVIKSYIPADVKFRSDLHTHMNANLPPDILIALGLYHQIRYPYYYIKKLQLRLSDAQQARLEEKRAAVAETVTDPSLTGKYRERRIDDLCFINFADLLFGNLPDAAANIARIRNSLAVMKDGQAVFTDLERVYLYRYVFTKGVPAGTRISLPDPLLLPDRDIAQALVRMIWDHKSAAFRKNTLFQDKLLWIARSYRRFGIAYAEISDTTLVKEEEAAGRLAEIHAVMPAVTAETGVTLRFLAAIRRIPLTIVRDAMTPADYLRRDLKVLRAVAPDPYIAGSDIVGEEINDIRDLQPLIRELSAVAAEYPGFVLRIHAGENDSFRGNVAGAIRCVKESLAEGQPFPPLRIGHGLYTSRLGSEGGQALLKALKENHVVLEFQITSNVRLNNLSSLSHHPLRQYLQAGIACVQGTDGGALYGTDSMDEQLALEKLLGLHPEELAQMRRAESEVMEAGQAAFREKALSLSRLCGEKDVRAFLEERIRETEPPLLPPSDHHLRDAESALRGQIRPLPEDKIPCIIMGGSFHNARRGSHLSESDRRLIDALLGRADPDRVFFVIGHRLTGQERYLMDHSGGRFEVYAYVPTRLTPSEIRRLTACRPAVRLTIEPTNMSLYKSIAYELFKHRRSVLIAFDGHAAGVNLIQAAKNNRFECRTFISRHSRTLREKGHSLSGYSTLFEDEAVAGEILKYL
ncbi:MAG: adenosine deaminase [Lachnospiraceae bacterium]|nr:adenosine deaminase [Lachnospiraceae bacterium]